MEPSPILVDNHLNEFPFDDDVTQKSKLEDHLADLANRHPEIADQLKGWGGFGKRSRPSEVTPEKREAAKNIAKEAIKKHQEESSAKENLRNTVPDMQQSQAAQDEVDRAQRSQSAPPESPSQFTKPVQPGKIFTEKPPEKQESKGPTVRHIPIHVEGRDEPLLPKEANEQVNQPTRPARKQQTQQECQTPLQKSQEPQQKQQPPPPQKQNIPQQKQNPPQQKQNPPQVDQDPPQVEPTPVPQQPPPPPDPLEQVAAVQKEIEELKLKISQGITKGSKDYIYLDEMLTRNLLKLDNIETEGKDEVRTARREAIRQTQEAINILESSPVNNNASN